MMSQWSHRVGVGIIASVAAVGCGKVIRGQPASPRSGFTVPRVVNVLDYGAKGDGLADDTAAFNRAIAVGADLGLEVFIPPAGAPYTCTGNIVFPGRGNVRVRGGFAQEMDASRGAIIRFAGTANGFTFSNQQYTVEVDDLQIITTPTAGPAIHVPPTFVLGDIYFHNIRIQHENSSAPAIQFGTDADSQGVQGDPVVFDRVRVNMPPAARSPAVALYGAQGGLSNVLFDSCVFSAPDLTATAPLVVLKSTDGGGMPNIRFRDVLFERPVAGAVTMSSVQSALLDNCWAGDLGIDKNTAPIFTIDRSDRTGAIASAQITFSNVFSPNGQSAAGREDVHWSAGEGSVDVTLIGSRFNSVNNGGPGNNPFYCIGSSVTHVIGDPMVGVGMNGNSDVRTRGISSTSTASRNLTGQATITGGGGTTMSYTFPTPEVDDNYHVMLTPTSWTGTPRPGSNRVVSIRKRPVGFTATLEADPGPGSSVTFDWIIAR